MERHFDEELGNLKSSILHMGSLVTTAISISVESLKQLNRAMAKGVVANDKVVDDMELKIHERCLNLLALRQPLAYDLRVVAMSMDITTDLERMADLAVDIAQRVLEIAEEPLLKPLIDIPKLAVLSDDMVQKALESFLKEDDSLAKEVILADNEADRLRNLVQSELINDYMMKDPACLKRAVGLLLVARHLERICDHATNIAEDVIYMVKAKVVRHHAERLNNGN